MHMYIQKAHNIYKNYTGLTYRTDPTPGNKNIPFQLDDPLPFKSIQPIFFFFKADRAAYRKCSWGGGECDFQKSRGRGTSNISLLTFQKFLLPPKWGLGSAIGSINGKGSLFNSYTTSVPSLAICSYLMYFERGGGGEGGEKGACLSCCLAMKNSTSATVKLSTRTPAFINTCSCTLKHVPHLVAFADCTNRWYSK